MPSTVPPVANPTIETMTAPIVAPTSGMMSRMATITASVSAYGTPRIFITM